MGEQTYTVGVMRVAVEETNPEQFQEMVDRAAARVEARLAQALGLQIEIFDFPGPHLTPMGGGYSPLHFLQIGLAEKLERRTNFLLLVTEVDLAASTLSYVVALPSQLTNVGILSTKRLSPTFWGRETDEELTTRRLASLMLHTLGHLLNLPRHDEATNTMYHFREVQDLDQMDGLTAAQIDQIRRNLPREAREEIVREGRARFALSQLLDNLHPIVQAVCRANPLRLVWQMPTMLTAALSVDIVLFFSMETWDVASTLSFTALIAFSLVTILVATTLLYRTFRLGPARDRTRGLAKSTIVTVTATFVTLLLAMVLFFLFFFGLALFGGLTFFPAALKETWPTVDPAVNLAEHLKLAFFLAGIGVLSGSLGGRADSKRIIGRVLFLDEEL